MYVLMQTVKALDDEIHACDEREADGDDEALVARILAGDAPLFERLYRRYHARTFALAYGMTGQRERADDLTQEIFLRAYQRLDSYHRRSRFATWFYRLATNHCLNYCRGERRHQGIEADVEQAWQQHHRPPANGSAAEERMAANLMRQQVQTQVRDALLTLPPKLRVLLVLREIEGLSYEEIAEQLDCSAGTVASGLSRARVLLAHKLEKLKGRV